MKTCLLLTATILATSMTAPTVSAEETAKTDCEAQAALVMEAVNGRKDGVRKGKTRRLLRAGLNRDAADLLADWVYELPEEHLTEEVGETWKTQCESL